MRKIWDFHGGIHPPENKIQSLAKPLQNAPVPQELVLPLNMHVGAPARPVVAVGDHVLCGQLIADSNGGFSAGVHASSSGEVVAIEDRPIAHPSGLTAPCIVIQTDGKDEWIEIKGNQNYRDEDPVILVDQLRVAGLAGLGGAGFPTAVKLQPRNKIDTLIINGTECEPYITADHELMRTNPDVVVRGAELLAYILGEPESVLIGVEDNKPDAIDALQKAIDETNDSRIELVVFPTKYPSGGEKQLIQILTSKEVPAGGLPSDLGIVVQNVGTAAAAWDAITRGIPLVSRITTMVGEALQYQGNLTVRIGTPVRSLLEFCGAEVDGLDRIVMGGPMMGFALPNADVPVTKITNCLIAPTTTELPPLPAPQPCIRCGACAEACPANLLPQQLLWYAQSENSEGLKDHNLFDCIECGACSYVCPSNIPLVQYYRASKGMIREAQREKIASDRARERFEARKERLEREAVERKAKREARMAAAQAKNSEGSQDDPVAAAIEKAAAKTEGNEERAGLERQLTTLNDRLSKLQAKVAEADNEDIRNKFAAQLKTTEAKIAKLEAQLQPEAGAE